MLVSNLLTLMMRQLQCLRILRLQLINKIFGVLELLLFHLPGSQKLSVTAVVKDRYYFKVTNTVKIDNIQELTLNQSFQFTIGAKLRLNNDSGSFINSGYIVKQDNINRKIYLAVNNNSWTNDTNTGQLVGEQFNEASTYNIVVLFQMILMK